MLKNLRKTFFPSYCALVIGFLEMLQFSLVFMLQNRGPRQKTRLADIITFGEGNSTILNQDGKTKILSCVAYFYSKCLAKMKNERRA